MNGTVSKYVGISVYSALDWKSQRVCCGETLRMPCGLVFTLHSIPDGGFKASVPCPCGDAGHWLVEMQKTV